MVQWIIMKPSNWGPGFWIIAPSCVIAALLIGFLIYRQQGQQDRYADETSREIALFCTTDMATQFHIHPVLKITVIGQNQVIPANVGITASCMHSIHTHDTSGTLHVESPVKKDFTLGDFFAIWGKEFNGNRILDLKADQNHPIRVIVNGTAVDTYENTVLRDKDKIEIVY